MQNRRRGVQGWAMGEHQPVMPTGPSRWELMIYREGLTEREVLENPRVVREWVLRNRGRAFVPEKVLEQLGLD